VEIIGKSNYISQIYVSQFIHSVILLQRPFIKYFHIAQKR